MMTLPSVEILVCTCRPEGAGRVAAMLLPPAEGVAYVVAWQESGGAEVPPALASRSDVRVVRTAARCLSENRNEAFEAARADILLVADDDLTYFPDAIRGLREAFARDPRMDVALFRHEGAPKAYPASAVVLTEHLPKGYYISSVEIAVRRSALADRRLRFSPQMGLATRYGCGEEEVWLLTAMRLGLKVVFLPLTLCRHDGATTGSRSRVAASTLRGFGAAMALIYPFTTPLRLPLKAWRLARGGQAGFFGALIGLAQGAWGGYFKIRRPWRG
ncbi:MAG: glycosyltransferase [Duncaniella sp.]|nr:glycosyltransferase [Duncaniella sp.]